jgi:DNA ligase-1
MKKLPKIYKRTSTGKTQEWEIIVDGNQYYTISGQKDGKQVQSKPTVCKGKSIGKSNETSAEEQALKEATAKRQLKLEGEYKELEEELENGVGFVKPMLAKDYKDYKDGLVFPVYSQRKLDGIRAIVQIANIKSRNGKIFKAVPHISEVLKPIFDKYPDIIFDGELYADKYADNFNTICSLVKQTKPTDEDLINSKNNIQYWIYDIVDTSLKFSDRQRKLKKLLGKLKSKYIKLLSTEIASNQEELDKFYEEYLLENYEGQIIRVDDTYHLKRTDKLLKRKEFDTSEYNVIDIIEGEGNRTGTAGYATLKTLEGKEFRSNIKGDFSFITQLLKDKKKIIGQEVTVRHFKFTPDKIPRFPYIIAIRDYE